MCDTCGCNVTSSHAHDGESVEVLQGLLAANDHQAAHNREHFERHGVRAINLMSSPGAGKTTIVPLALLDAAWRDDRRIVVLEPRRLAPRLHRLEGAQLLPHLGEPLVHVHLRARRRKVALVIARCGITWARGVLSWMALGAAGRNGARR